MVAFCFDIGRKRFVYLVLTIEKWLWRYALSSSDNMKWIIKTEPTSRWILYTIFGQHVLCTETEWRWMFVSNRYRVNFEVQCRYATWQVPVEKKILFCWDLLLIRSIILLEGLYLITYALIFSTISPFRYFANSCLKHAPRCTQCKPWPGILHPGYF